MQPESPSRNHLFIKGTITPGLWGLFSNFRHILRRGVCHEDLFPKEGVLKRSNIRRS